MSGIDIVRAYYTAFNQGDWNAMVDVLTDDVVHDINQGETEIGHDAFRKFMLNMALSYNEQIDDLILFSGEGAPNRVAAEFMIRGRYIKHSNGMPDARGQNYHLRVGAFFELRGEKICRITNYYNLYAWMRQVRR